VPPNLTAIVGLVRRRWTQHERQRSAAAQVAVDVEELRHTDKPTTRTTVRITAHSLPDFRTQSPRAALRITQKPQLLLPWQFDDVVIAKLEQASLAKGRRIYCLDARRDIADQVLAAVSFHVDADKSLPLRLIALALRLSDPDTVAQSYAASWYLLRYISAAGVKLGRGASVDFVTHADALADLAPLGFLPVTPSPYPYPHKCLRLS
jgi:hypothetical protein